MHSRGRAKRDRPCEYMPTRGGEPLYGWGHLEKLTRAIVHAGIVMREYASQEPIRYRSRSIPECSAPSYDYSTISEEALAEHIKDMESKLERLSWHTLPETHAKHIESDYRLVMDALDALTDEKLIWAIKRAYIDAKAFSGMNHQAYEEAKERLKRQLREAKSHTKHR